MDIYNTFKVAMEITELAKKYDLEETGNSSPEEIQSRNFAKELDVIHDKLLYLGKFSKEDVLEKEAVNTVSVTGLPSYSKLIVYYVYEDEQMALVEDTAMNLHLIPLEIVKFNE
ncbi:hypothetical protein [Paenibacillus sp. XY044]|uniref:hypothetical protein n=1 Tax=Paenibacillus sp. XY044 TaxID=2026089 RepID=UPI000B97DD48|nr:hypothetical protein [Paenibacillus sp. XY044]OZB98125.1 hypothetical protein CJP46_02855 [Paenibacillus sp. XY044]